MEFKIKANLTMSKELTPSGLTYELISPQTV